MLRKRSREDVWGFFFVGENFVVGSGQQKMSEAAAFLLET
jgi:hypothetical protein